MSCRLLQINEAERKSLVACSTQTGKCVHFRRDLGRAGLNIVVHSKIFGRAHDCVTHYLSSLFEY